MTNDDDQKIKFAVSGGVSDRSIKAEIEGDQKTIREFFSGLVPDFIKDGAGIISDRVKLWRWSNQVNIIKKAQEKIITCGLSKKHIPLKVLAPIIENSSLEEDLLMQDKWANLLANAATGRKEISPNYAAILNELSPTEALILDKIFDTASQESDYQKRKLIQFDKPQMQKILSIGPEKADLIVENLFRLNLLQSPGSRGASMGNFPFALRTNEIFEFTTLGYEFVKVCRWENGV